MSKTLDSSQLGSVIGGAGKPEEQPAPLPFQINGTVDVDPTTRFTLTCTPVLPQVGNVTHCTLGSVEYK